MAAPAERHEGRRHRGGHDDGGPAAWSGGARCGGSHLVGACAIGVEQRHGAGVAVDPDLAGRSCTRRVATPVPSTAGIPYSRATIELWLNGPPMSVTTPEAMANNDVQAGVVMLATSTSPDRMRAKSRGTLEHPGRRGDLARAGADATQHVAGLLGGETAGIIDAKSLGRASRRSGSSCGGAGLVVRPATATFRCATPHRPVFGYFFFFFI